MAFEDICITSDILLTADPSPDEAFRLPEVPGVGVVFEKAEERQSASAAGRSCPTWGRHAHPGRLRALRRGAG